MNSEYEKKTDSAREGNKMLLNKKKRGSGPQARWKIIMNIRYKYTI